jgi:hypothetical protein
MSKQPQANSKPYNFTQFTGEFLAKDDHQALDTMKALAELIKVIGPDDIIKLGKLVKQNPDGWKKYKFMLNL